MQFTLVAFLSLVAVAIAGPIALPDRLDGMSLFSSLRLYSPRWIEIHLRTDVCFPRFVVHCGYTRPTNPPETTC